MTASHTVVISGGASGIGLALTRHFAATPDSRPVILDVDRTAADAALSSLRSEFPSANVSFVPCDVSSWDSQAAAFEEVYARHGRIDVVVANAGITEKGDLLEGIGEDHPPTKPNLTTLDVDLVGVIYSVKLAAHYIAKNTPSPSASKGCIICTASNAGLYPFPIAPVYSTAKHGVIGLVRSLARRLERENIRINALAPAVIETNIAPSSDLFRAMALTPMETALHGVEALLREGTTGKIAELHGERVTMAEPPAYVDEDTGRNIERFWELGYA